MAKILEKLQLPKVAVLMATYNGERWLQDQIDSILAQRNVEITLYISDDQSSDGTWELLKLNSARDDRICLLERNQKFGQAGKNFYRLIKDVELQRHDFFAFSDQDDVWKAEKLDQQVRAIETHRAEGVSSNVEAFWENGTTKLINKAQPQRKLDYLFESAGPGCTFLMTPWLVKKLQETLDDTTSPARNVALHDWLAYAVCRTHQRNWHIGEIPTVLYRQHTNNVLGANTGFKAKLARLRKLNAGWYRQEIMKIAAVCTRLSGDRDAQNIRSSLQAKRYSGLLPYLAETRRKLSDRLWLTVMVMFRWL
jgi:rhamnosyltransferase